MSILSKSSHLSIVLVAAALTSAGCTTDATSPSTSSTTGELDVIGLAERPASLLVLSPTATVAQRQRLERVLVRLGGAVLESHPPRLIIAQVPEGADAALTAAGMVARFDRAVTAADLAAATLPEERFLSVHAARWFPGEVPQHARLMPIFAADPGGEGEGSPQRLAAGAVDAPTIDPEDLQPVPFASGTVVVSIVLPESNGSVDASTEDWSEPLVRETYLKVQSALDKIAASEPNADLKFVVHYESAPAAGGLAGTVDTRYEFGQRAQWASPDESLATADVMSSILGRTVTEADLWNATVEYDASLKARYGADAAFFVMVAANGNGTAWLRPHAWIGGPHTVLDSMQSHEVFAHEFGHIFGAYDEYCPDACSPPTSIQGYLGIYNANAAYQQGGPGIDDGRGEGAPSLMQYNQPGAVNGYTRGAWGWLDTDGDGVVEVRDTFPRAALTATATGRTVRVSGMITDRGDSRMWSTTRYSANRIDALEYAFAANGPWFRVALPADTRGRQAVDTVLGEVPAGTRDVWVRGVNSVGNVEARPAPLRITTTQTGNSAPHLRLDVPARAGTTAAITVTTAVQDLDGGTVQVRYDVDGNGTWDTAYQAAGAYSFTAAAAGLRTVKAQARDAQGATRIVTAEIPVVSGAAAPVLALGNLPSLVHGATNPAVTLAATAPGATVEVITELATDDDRYRTQAAVSGGTATTTLPTPASLRSFPLDLTTGDEVLARQQVRDVATLDADHVAVAAGGKGVWIVDITDRHAPRVMSTLALETSANRLWKHGNRLYVLGTYLTIVDVSNPALPREWKQFDTVVKTVGQTNEETLDIPEASGYGIGHFYGLGQGAKITSAKVVVTVNHPRIADLVIRLVPGKGSGIAPVVLRDHQGGPSGLRTFTYTSANSQPLRAIHGGFADDYWTVEVMDDLGNGQVGQLVSTRLELRTGARAVEVIDNASEIAGVTAYGDLIVAGSGLEALDVAFPQWVTSLARVTGTGTQTASMSGDTAIVAMALESKNPDGTPADVRLRGLCAVDFHNPFFPRVVRCETGLGGYIGEHAQLGGRIYVGVQPSCNHEENCEGAPFTIAGDASRFARGLTWRLGQTSERVDRWAVGAGASSLWTITYNGTIARLDVSNPAGIVRTKHYPRTFAGRMLRLNMPEVMLFDFGAMVRIARLGDDQNILSRVYRITVEARAAGKVTRASRTVHVIPYDHAPAVVSAVVARRDETSPYRVRLVARDGDQGATWDPSLFGRVDFDADGSFDTDWAFMGYDGTSEWTGEAELGGVAPGVYPQAIVEVRDGFWARARSTVSLTVP